MSGVATATGPFGSVGTAVDREARRALVLETGVLDGIDFVEVGPDRTTLFVHLLRTDHVADLAADRVQILGGVRQDPRINPVGVLWAHPALRIAGPGGIPPGPLPAGVTNAHRLLVNASLAPSTAARANVLVVLTSSPGDASTYVLQLTGPNGKGLPTGFDEPLAGAPFSFAVDCPSTQDCCAPPLAPVLPSGSPLQDYLARDYEALRGRLVDRLGTLMPTWTDRSPADPVVMLAELFAALGDRLAYWQDAVAVEAYLSTARQRTSVRRHARLLDYAVHEGCSARVWLALTTDVPTALRAGAPVAEAVPTGSAPTPLDVHLNGGTVFQTVADADLHPHRNAVPLYAWGDTDHVLPAGSTAAFLAVPAGQGDLGLAAGDVLVLSDLPGPSADTPVGTPETGDPALRFAVRLDRAPVVHQDTVADPDLDVLEVHWLADDALPVALRVSAAGPDGTAQPRAVALANVVLADHGAGVPPEALVAPEVVAGADGGTSGQPYRPRVRRTGVAVVDPAPHPLSGPASVQAGVGATVLGTPDPRRAIAAVTLQDGSGRTWVPVPDLIASGRFDPHVVVEPEAGGVSRLRFGDGVTGRSPGTEPEFLASCRLGGGSVGNVGAGRLVTWLERADGTPLVDSGAVVRVWNPLPANGGTDPEDLGQVRRLAPFAFRSQLRAVTTDDYAAAADTVPGVQRSVDRRRWTGSWYVHEVTVDPVAAFAADETAGRGVTDAVGALLEVRRTAGQDVEVARPVYVPLLVTLAVCPAPGSQPADVEPALRDALSSRVLPGGALGLFHPDRLTFGRPLYVSDVVATAMAVPGVGWVDVVGLARLGDPPSASVANLAAGVIRVSGREVLRCDSDPDNPDAGRVDLVFGGSVPGRRSAHGPILRRLP